MSHADVGPGRSVLRAPVEQRFGDELERLAADDNGPRPPGWKLSPRAVRSFLLGNERLAVSRKFYGDDPLVERAIVSLMGAQGLMLVGEPGTAKSMISELLAAAVSGDSGLVVQGSAGTTEDHVRYSWNYALLLAEGPTKRALVPSPVLDAMRDGRVVRFEEITRCPPEVQDALISTLSEKTLFIPEMGDAATIRAAPGFNVIGTANLRDRGVHEMSSALKRRFNFETVRPLSDPAFEQTLILREVSDRLGDTPQVPAPSEAVLDVLVQTFMDLRTGKTRDGTRLAQPEAVMSTAEAVNVAHAASLEAGFLDNAVPSGAHVARQMQGVVLKDNPEDGKKFRAYVDHVAKDRAKRSVEWKAFYDAARKLHLG